MILVDSSVWIDFFNGTPTREAETLDRLLASEPVAIGDLIYAEVLQGFSSAKAFRRAKAALDELECYDLVGRDMALKAALNFRKLRDKGVTVRKTVDVLIATFCIERGVALLHRDRDFDAFEEHLGLAVVR